MSKESLEDIFNFDLDLLNEFLAQDSIYLNLEEEKKEEYKEHIEKIITEGLKGISSELDNFILDRRFDAPLKYPFLSSL